MNFSKLIGFKNKTIFQKNWFWLFLIFVVSVLAFRTLIQKGYFPMHDDLQMMRQLELDKCFSDGQIPCRWVPDMGYGFGFPLFNFYPPLPYLVGEIFRVFGFAFTDVAKAIFSFSFIASGAAMFFFAKDIFVNFNKKLANLAAFSASVFYIWAPYHAVDVFVRGAMNEDWAMIFFPLILWTSYRLIRDSNKLSRWVIGLSLSWVGLFLSHNLMVMIFTPIFVAWCLIFLWKESRWSRIRELVISGALILGLVAFFTLPAFFEQKYVQVNTLISGYYEYIAHFATINQLLFSRFWGYGASIWGPEDGMPFPAGQFHWVISLLVLAFIFIRTKKAKKMDVSTLSILFLVLVGWFSLFMAHSRSTVIWQHIKSLSFVQFPWRFLTIPTFTFSFASGFFVLILSRYKKAFPYLVLALFVGLLAWNWNFFRVERMGPVTDAEKFSGEAWRIQQTAGIYDYLPGTARMAPQGQRINLTEIMDGHAFVTNQKQGTDWASFDIDVSSENAIVRMGILEFPIWKSYIDGTEVPNYVDKEETWGRMYVDIPKGTHSVYFKLYNTPIRTLGNWISLVSWSGLIIYLLWARKNGKHSLAK